MSTSCLIGKLNLVNNSVRYVYCHSDGYVEGVGRVLQQHYTSPSRIAFLLNHGDLSHLGPKIGRRHNFDKARAEHPDWCVFYIRDRRESLSAKIAPKKATQREFWENGNHSYLYLFNGYEWFYKNIRKEMKVAQKLSDLFVPVMEVV